MFEGLCISGGGIKGIAHLGALHKYWEEGLINFDSIKKFSGASVGAYICLLINVGYTPMEIFASIYKMERFFEKVKTEKIWDTFKQYYYSDFGILSNEIMNNEITRLVEAKLGKVPTLFELYELTGKELYISVGNVTKMSMEYFSYKTQPHINCITAARMSGNLPGVFPKMMYNGYCYVDGGIGDNFPLSCIDDGKIKILGLLVKGGFNTDSENESFLNYMMKSQMISIKSNENFQLKNAGNNVSTVSILLKKILFIELSLTPKEKMDMFVRGYTMAEFSLPISEFYIKID